MIVSLRAYEVAELTTRDARYITAAQTFLSEGKQYEVHAVSVYDGVCFLLVVDDLSSPSFEPRALFDVRDSSIPSDWICNTFPTGPVQMVMGPEFIARDVDSYDGMIDQREEQVARFWARIQAARQSRHE